MIARLRSGRHLTIREQMEIADRLERLKRIVREQGVEDTEPSERRALETAARCLA